MEGQKSLSCNAIHRPKLTSGFPVYLTQAYFNSALIATFSPTAPRALVVQPSAHRFMDHLLIGVLLLMREKDDTVYARTDYSTMELPPFA